MAERYIASPNKTRGDGANFRYKLPLDRSFSATARAALAKRRRFVANTAASKRRADLVVISLHIGGRYQREPEAFEARLGHQTIDAGANIACSRKLGPTPLAIAHHPTRATLELR